MRIDDINKMVKPLNQNKMTAVEWLIQEHFGGIENCTPDFRNKIEQAKEMENEFIQSLKQKHEKIKSE